MNIKKILKNKLYLKKLNEPIDINVEIIKISNDLKKIISIKNFKLKSIFFKFLMKLKQKKQEDIISK